MNVRTKHWTLKPHRNMRQHKVFLRHELLKYNSEKSTAKSSALENYISSANLSLSGCSSAEPNSVSVGRCKFQLKKLYLQTVKKVDHLPLLSFLILENQRFHLGSYTLRKLSIHCQKCLLFHLLCIDEFLCNLWHYHSLRNLHYLLLFLCMIKLLTVITGRNVTFFDFTLFAYSRSLAFFLNHQK